MPCQNFIKSSALVIFAGTILGGCVAPQADVYYVPYGPRYARPAPRYEVVEEERIYRPRRRVVYAEPVERYRPAPRPRQRYEPVAERPAPPVTRRVPVGVDPAAREGGFGGGGGGGW